MERKRKGFWAIPVSAQRRVAAAVPIKIRSREDLCAWWSHEKGDVCGSSRCYDCADEWDTWDRDTWDRPEPQFMCLSRQSRALAMLGVDNRLMDPCDCDACGFHGFGTIGDLRSAAPLLSAHIAVVDR